MFESTKCETCASCGGCQQTMAVDTPSLFCMNCQPSDAPCLIACKENAIEILGNAITINKDKCIKCKDCVEVCPNNIINI